MARGVNGAFLFPGMSKQFPGQFPKSQDIAMHGWANPANPELYHDLPACGPFMRKRLVNIPYMEHVGKCICDVYR